MKTLRSPTARLATLVPLLTLAACSHPAPEPPTPEQREAAISLTVINKDFRELRVYAVSQGVERRVGSARAAAETTLSFPASYLTPTSRAVVFKAEPMGGGRPLFSQQLTIQPGVAVEWTIENNLTSSSVMMR